MFRRGFGAVCCRQGGGTPEVPHSGGLQNWDFRGPECPFWGQADAHRGSEHEGNFLRENFSCDSLQIYVKINFIYKFLSLNSKYLRYSW